MFPASFVKVIVPLNDNKGSVSQQSQRPPTQTVTALYSFAAETWDDLELQVSAALYEAMKQQAVWHCDIAFIALFYLEHCS
jgi:hypothetical protein